MSNKKMGFQDTINWYNANAKKYDKNYQKASSPKLLDDFAKRVGKGARVLDAGCASGRDSNLLEERGLIPVGVDLSEELLKIAKNKFPNIQFKHANFLKLPFKGGSFDGVWVHASLLHLETAEDVLRALSEFYRVLKKGGVIHILVKQQQGDIKTEVVSDKLSGHDRFFQWFTKNEIENILEKIGFNIEFVKDNIDDIISRKEVKWIHALAKK